MVIAVLATTTCSGPAVELSDVRLGAPTGPNAALYFTASGSSDRLVGAETAAALSVEIHESSVGGDGAVTMRRLDGLDLRSGEPLILEPGGLHLMLIGVERFDVGDTVEITLRWETAGDMTIEAAVVHPAETMGGE